MDFLEQGNLYRRQGKFDFALREFELAVVFEPNDDIAWLELGKTYKMMDRCPDALQKFTQAVRINPNNKEAIIELGETARLSNSCECAIKEFIEILNKGYSNEVIHIELGKAYQKIDSHNLALDELNRAYTINPTNSGTLLGIGQIYKAQGNYEEAFEKFAEAIKLDPNNKEAHIELGLIYKQQKDYQSAINEFEAASDIAPLDIKIRLNLVEINALKNDFSRSEKEAEETLRIMPDEPFSRDVTLNEIEILQGKTILKSKVKRLWVTLTSRCNIRCRTCGLWSNPWDLPRKAVDEVIALYPYLERIVWLGGEVFLFEFFDEMFQKAKAYPHLNQQIITNGVILSKEWIEKIVCANVELTFSVDGVTKEVYEYIRRGASFEKLLYNIRLTNELRETYHSMTKVRMNALIMKSNYHQIEEFVEFAKEYKFDQLSLLAVHFDEDPNENILYTKRDDQALEYITGAISKVRQKASDYNIDLDVLLPTTNLKFDEFQSDIQGEKSIEKFVGERLHCKMPWKYLFICDEGNVYLTGSCVKRIGNINENSIDEIWNSLGAQLYRESMLKNQFQEICRSECMTRWEV